MCTEQKSSKGVFTFVIIHMLLMLFDIITYWHTLHIVITYIFLHILQHCTGLLTGIHLTTQVLNYLNFFIIILLRCAFHCPEINFYFHKNISIEGIDWLKSFTVKVLQFLSTFKQPCQPAANINIVHATLTLMKA